MKIQKSNIVEVWNINHNKVIKYSQILVNKESNTVKELVAEDLTSLINKVRSQVEEWSS